MDLIITSRLVIPSRELKWRFSRSSGPGGQKVNKTNTRVEIIFNIEESKVLNDYQKKVLTKKLKTKLVLFDLDGTLIDNQGGSATVSAIQMVRLLKQISEAQ